MDRYELKRPESFKTRKRVGCGPSSGNGKTCGRGMNGQKCRAGSTSRAWFEGGQMPLQRRVPKRGFNNYTKKTYQIVSLDSLDKLSAKEITPDILMDNGLIDQSKRPVKILGNGDIKKALKVTADSFTKSAIDKIKKAGGDVVTREYPIKKNTNTGK